MDIQVLRGYLILPGPQLDEAVPTTAAEKAITRLGQGKHPILAVRGRTGKSTGSGQIVSTGVPQMRGRHAVEGTYSLIAAAT